MASFSDLLRWNFWKAIQPSRSSMMTLFLLVTPFCATKRSKYTLHLSLC